jgi:hypothetical protein
MTRVLNSLLASMRFAPLWKAGLVSSIRARGIYGGACRVCKEGTIWVGVLARTLRRVALLPPPTHDSGSCQISLFGASCYVRGPCTWSL